jgi:hemoglobin
MKKTLFALALAAITTLGGTAFAQASAPADSVFQSFGGKPGLARLMDDFMVRLLADPRTGPHFKPSNQQRVKEQLVEQFCQVTGGPCVYKGADMKTAHGNLDIKKSDFNALVEVLQQSMDAQGIPFSVQNRLLAQLAPMYRDVITVQ